jgi:hypothetical protein
MPEQMRTRSCVPLTSFSPGAIAIHNKFVQPRRGVFVAEREQAYPHDA